jgi:hypothetical protein
LLCKRSRSYRRRCCPRCGHSSYRDGLGRRSLHDLGCPLRGRPRVLVVVYSRHFCTRCQRYFGAEMSDLAPPGSHYTGRVISWRCVWWPRTACPTVSPPGTCGATTASSSPSPPSRTGSRRRGKKELQRVEGPYLDEALAGFSGYLALDELYDGPFCVLSAVDPHQQRRLLLEVLDHDPSRLDVLFFLARLNEHIRQRGHAVLGVTTDASSLYPLPIRLAFGPVPHQVCEFHVKKELLKVVLAVVARWRKRLAEQKPSLPPGRPGKGKKAVRLRQKAREIGRRISDLFEHRYLFVRRHLDAEGRALLRRVTRADRWLRVLRGIVDEVYRLFDRRCRTDTALAKLARLRRRVRRYPSLVKVLDKLNSPNLEKALTFLDDELLQATSNAVERGNRRHRKMQKTVYRVRKQEALQGRLALDLQREAQASDRLDTLTTLHQSRQ